MRYSVPVFVSYYTVRYVQSGINFFVSAADAGETNRYCTYSTCTVGFCVSFFLLLALPASIRDNVRFEGMRPRERRSYGSYYGSSSPVSYRFVVVRFSMSTVP